MDLVQAQIESGEEVDFFLKKIHPENIRFEWLCSRKRTEEEAAKRQADAGYIPMGYNFLEFKESRLFNHKPVYLYTWKCYSSCD